jgi:Fur family transcriptional regulator, zinc uptake regulator
MNRPIGQNDGFPGEEHDHGTCVGEALDRAEALCRQTGARLTALRRRVLEIVWAGHKPVGAYDILDALREERRKAAPPTVYRALEFLMEHRLVHRIESLNAFVGCCSPETSHGGQFLICNSCGAAVELDDARIGAAIAESAEKAGFTVERRVVEVEGVCPHCRDREAGRD